jgi:hypothetical protein
MHLIPSFLLTILTVIAWKHERVGGSIFLAFGILFLLFTHFQAIIVSIPAFIIGALFLSGEYLSRIQLKKAKKI